MAGTQSIHNEKARQFALQTVRKLRTGGFISYWAGGCVRDQFLDKIPVDYDVATNAVPTQIRKLFGEKQTIPIGVDFGVITLKGTKATGNIEIATFRQDGAYSDGRHPDAVCYSNAEEDALRRDFTINGMFFDPIDEQCIDYVNGQADIAARTIRAIGDPAERFHEDKLRILRAIRFATTLNFTIEPATLAVIKQMPKNLDPVKRERILVELKKTLTSEHRQTGLNLLLDTGFLSHAILGITTPESNQDADWQTMLQMSALDQQASFVSTLAMLYKTLACDSTVHDVQTDLRRMKMSNDDITAVCWILENLETFAAADQNRWPEVQQLLINPLAPEAVKTARNWVTAQSLPATGIEFCEQKLSLSDADLNPAVLLNGRDLTEIGMHPGPAFSKVLSAVRDAQLLGDIDSKEAAIQLAKETNQQL